MTASRTSDQDPNGTDERTRRRKILLSTIGSRGDVQPLLALALELRALRYDAVLCVAPNFRAWVESFGIDCIPIGPDLQELTAKGAADPRRSSGKKMRELIRDTVREQFRVLDDAARGCDLIVVGGALQTAGRSIAEVLDIPYVYVSYCPATLPSPDHPPPRVRSQRLPRWTNRLLWLAYERMWNAVFRHAVNEQRAARGLIPVADIPRHIATDRPWLAADPVLAPAASPIDMQVIQMGAWFLADTTPLPDQLEAFLADGEPPIYFGFGSIRTPAQIRVLLDAARMVGRRAIVSRGWANLSLADVGNDCISVGDVDHEKLFSRVATVVHHGGTGTTTAAARAGKPQVVLPHLYDQHFWAHRVEQLRIGVSCRNVERLMVDDLARALRGCLEGDSGARARALAKEIGSQHARVAAERLVEDLLRIGSARATGFSEPRALRGTLKTG